jgi:peptidoglycan hydrolase-like protein with peptidoglycan-binding domain
VSKPNYSDWPKKGDTRAQPWETPDSGVTPRAGLPLLVSGGATGPDPTAQALFTALAELGYETPISRGANPFGTIGAEELAAVRQFRRDYGVRENPEAFGGDNPQGNMVAESHIGPYTGEAILRAAAAKGAPAETPDAELAALRERVVALESKQTSGGSTASEHGRKLASLARRLEKVEQRQTTPAPKAAAAS